MSAWDIAGVVVWSPVALFLLGAVCAWTSDGSPTPPEHRGAPTTAIVLGLSALAAAAFCIARLFGAHA